MSLDSKYEPRPFHRRYSRLNEIKRAFDREALRSICQAHERQFGAAYGMTEVKVDQPAPENYYFYKDNGSDVLAVAHLDTVGAHEDRKCRFVLTEGAGTVVFSRALDDRLGAYVILELLPKLGLTYDILLTVGEESGSSTAAYFEPPAGKEYRYMIEFDRGGTDVVMYQYDDAEVREMVRACGATPADGIFSDISYLGHLGIKGFNWGVGYRDYHGPKAHAFLDDTFRMVSHYLDFHDQNEGTAMPHYESDHGIHWGRSSWGGSTRGWRDWVDEDDEMDRLWRGEKDDDPDLPDFVEHPSLEQVNAAVAAIPVQASEVEA